MPENDIENKESAITVYHNSNIYKCYNGIMMGFFIIGAFGNHVKGKYPFVRQRIQEVLNETGMSSFGLPENHEDFIANHTVLSSQLVEKLYKDNNPLKEYYFLGCTIYTYWAMAFQGDTEDTINLKQLIDQLLERLNISKEIVSDLLKEIIEENKKLTLDSGVLLSGELINSKSLKLLNTLIASLPFEEKTGFVSMPFKLPYIEYYNTYYTKALKELTPTVIRAWGGFGGEEYQTLMFTLIEKCGVLLADITEINPNVIIEFAYAWGFKKPLVLLTANKHLFQGDKFSNISDTVCYQYDSNDANWPTKAITELGLVLSLAKVGLEIENKSKGSVD